MSQERRRYFRIDDSLGVAYSFLGSEEAKAFAEQAREGGGGFDLASNFDNRIQTLLDACRVQAPIAVELIDLVNKKLNFVIQQMDVDAELMHRVAYNMRQVNISACGMAFANDESLASGQMLQLDLLLHPSELHVSALATVVACDAVSAESVEESARYFVRLDFVELSQTNQELLIQHIVKRQSVQLKERRQQLASQE